MEPWILFANAEAGLHRGSPSAEELASRAREMAIEVELVTPGNEEELSSALQKKLSEGARQIAIAGGDGTVHAAIQCLAESEATLAIIPVGTRNNFAHALGLPLELDRALELLKTGVSMGIDLGCVNGTYFSEAAGVGVFADILDAYGQTNKNFWRGIYAITRTFFNLRSRRLRLTIDGVKVSERAVMCTVANAYRMGAGAPMAPGASVVDGQLDVVILGDLSRLELLAYYRAIRANRHLALPKVQTTTAKSVSIQAAISLPVHVDDRVIGTTPIQIEIRPACLRVVVKQR